MSIVAFEYRVETPLDVLSYLVDFACGFCLDLFDLDRHIPLVGSR